MIPAIILIMLQLIEITNTKQIPYVFIDFDVIYQTGIWENTNKMGQQLASNGNVSLDDDYSLSTVPDQYGIFRGVFKCDNQASGSYYSTPNTAAYLPQLTFSAFTLEVIVRPTKNDELFFGYIIGIEATNDNIAGNAIGYNRVSGDMLEHSPNKFFASNIEQEGWRSSPEYWASASDTAVTDISQFHHVIVTQSNIGMVTVFVDGAQYGISYAAGGGMRQHTIAHPAWHIKICGDGAEYTGFDGYIRAFAFYTESLTPADVLNACYAAQNTTNMIYCGDTTETTSLVTGAYTTMESTSDTEQEITHSDWIVKEGANCGDGYTDLHSSSVYYGEYCQQCPQNQAGTYGICKTCDAFQEPNHSRTDCEYYQPWWLWLIQVICGSGCMGVCVFMCHRMKAGVKKAKKSFQRSSRDDRDDW
eukprot:630297_1